VYMMPASYLTRRWYTSKHKETGHLCYCEYNPHESGFFHKSPIHCEGYVSGEQGPPEVWWCVPCTIRTHGRVKFLGDWCAECGTHRAVASSNRHVANEGKFFFGSVQRFQAYILSLDECGYQGCENPIVPGSGDGLETFCEECTSEIDRVARMRWILSTMIEKQVSLRTMFNLRLRLRRFLNRVHNRHHDTLLQTVVLENVVMRWCRYRGRCYHCQQPLSHQRM